MDDLERIELALIRLEHHRRAATADPVAPSALAHWLSLQAALDTLPIPIFIKDRNRRYTASNRAFADYLGLAAGEIVGKTVFDVAPDDLAAIYDRSDVDHLARGGTQSYESQVRHADGSLHDVVFHKAIFLDPAGERTASSARYSTSPNARPSSAAWNCSPRPIS